MECDETLVWYESSPGVRRGFCGKCGSTLFWDDRSRDYIAIAAGSLNQPTGIKLIKHIYVADKGDYYMIEGCMPSDIRQERRSGVNSDLE